MNNAEEEVVDTMQQEVSPTPRSFDPSTGEIYDKPKTEKPQPQPQPKMMTTGNGVLAMLAAIDRGRFMHDLEDDCREVVQASSHHQKKGRVTITLDFNPDSQTQAMRVTADIKKTIPRPPAHASYFFPTPEGNLSRIDSRQSSMLPETE